jgi:hypothetical protein
MRNETTELFKDRVAIPRDQLNDLLAKELKYDGLKRALAGYNTAARKFVAKVDSGKARSVETYADLKACLAAADELETERL